MSDDKIKKLTKQNQVAMVEVEKLSVLLQVAIQALVFITKPVPPVVLVDSANTPKPHEVATAALAKMKELRTAANRMQKDIKSGKIVDLSTERGVKNETPPVRHLNDGDVIVFSPDHDLYFHKCCGCGLIHEVETEWGGVEDGFGNVAPKLETTWTRRDTPPTKQEMVERGFEIDEKGDAS